ncbi:MAG: uridine kinase [Verrucomicrobiota bacterium]|nr:uridine kinase [Verrucomicrobiota bacterium]
MTKTLLILLLISSSLLSSPLIIGVSGGTASGKTTFTRKIQEVFPQEIVVISQDSYFKHLPHLTLEERMSLNWDCPDAVDFDLLQEHLLALKEGYSIQQPVRNFFTFSRENFTRQVSSARIIVLEGILVFTHPAIRNLCDIKIYIEASDDIRLLRRILRDIKERGANIHDIATQYVKYIKPMHDCYVEPTKDFADIIIPQGGESQVSFNIVRDAIAKQIVQK